MRSTVLFFLLITALASVAQNPTIANKKLDGMWVPVKLEIDGAPLPSATFEKQKLTLVDSNYTFVAESVDKGMARYSDGKMDLYGRDGVNAGKHFTAIYKLENEQLVICYNLAGDSYPENFETKGKPTFFLAVFKKIVSE
jgi:uncharacterized protein (TIGR03067 family)